MKPEVCLFSLHSTRERGFLHKILGPKDLLATASLGRHHDISRDILAAEALVRYYRVSKEFDVAPLMDLSYFLLFFIFSVRK